MRTEVVEVGVGEAEAAGEAVTGGWSGRGRVSWGWPAGGGLWPSLLPGSVVSSLAPRSQALPSVPYSARL